uniref:NADH-ubiquinone oxidoreductase chain 6 n=1 Tax=Staphylinidae sp. BMNH 1274642 TaxID=1796583 RepID=A0A126TE78_9COLE|nr:NADH dehydrogenase subunit 6 [Staphylinidae sp. BMNH 1274642]
MLCIMLMILMIMSFMLIFFSHPMSMGMILLTQTILIALYTGMMNFNYWFSYILFLIMVGGMLVLFTYMTSVASNEKFKFSSYLMTSFIIFILISMIFLLIDNKLLSMMNFSVNFTYVYDYKFSMSKFFNWPSNLILFMMIIYLFITLIAIVKLTNIKTGPLRQKF